MYCSKCGKETNNSTHICDACDSNKNSVMVVNNQNKGNKAIGIISLVFGILSLVDQNFIFGIVAIILGKGAKDTQNEKLGRIGKNLGIAGIIVSVVFKLFMIFVLVIYFCFFGFVLVLGLLSELDVIGETIAFML